MDARDPPSIPTSPEDIEPSGGGAPSTAAKWRWLVDTTLDGQADQDITFGRVTEDRMLPARDYDGDGRDDLAVYGAHGRNEVLWRIDTNQDGRVDIETVFGKMGDVLVPADYDCDGAADFAVVTPQGRHWRWLVDLDRDGRVDREAIFGERTSDPDFSDRPNAGGL